jgi:hypothetical protein
VIPIKVTAGSADQACMTITGDASTGVAGASAEAEAELALFNLALVTQEVSRLEAAGRELKARAARYSAGSAGERSIWSAVRDHLSTDWVLLADRKWPGTRSANIDLVVVGPGGVFVIDAKRWTEPVIADGRLHHGSMDRSEEVEKVCAQADAIAAELTAIGLSPNQVHPAIVLAGHDLQPTRLGEAYVLGEHNLAPYWAAHGPRLSAHDVQLIVDALAEIAPPMNVERPPAVTRAVPASPREIDSALLTVDDVIDSSRRVAEAGSIERWMSWIDPQQSPLVRRPWNGPARIRGAAGTGKTVVALHRAEHLARRSQSVLMTSYVRTLSDVHQTLFSMLAPDLDGVVTFKGLHAWCRGYLRERGIELNLEARPERRLFPLALSRSGALRELAGLDVPSTGYWWDEITTVIKGRGITAADEYYSTSRSGRGVPLQRTHREAVWAAYEAYQQRLRDESKHDWFDLLSLALAELEKDDTTTFDAVVVDEVQDLPVVGLRIVERLTRANPAGLLLVGDGQQAVYPGGGSLREAGISVTGRSTVLTQNYRNCAAVLERALAVVEADQFDDLGDVPEPGRRDLDFARSGGTVEEQTFTTLGELRANLVARLRDLGDRRGSAAVLLRSNQLVEDWIRLLSANGIAAQDLRDYRGRTSSAVKVGTYQRAKGLEFAFVAVPHHNLAIESRRTGESEEHFNERAALQRRQLFVAMTRARDSLWLGTVAPRGVGGAP